ncbi:MAG: HutD family protein [Niveispirillum sp.]|uniref:HutD/Ves family protein n=1 Tax=Niveispirillum sp. TaxID=1917217 RepID=UPI003BA557AE
MSGLLLRATDRLSTPWKNGGGETATVAVFPEGAGLSDFDWRVSIARVDGDGPFSAFPGIDRTLTLLSGGSMALNGHVLTPVSAPYAFDGGDAVQAVVSGGPVHDLNVMTRRGRFSHSVARVRGPVALGGVPAVRLLLALDRGYRGLGAWDALLLGPEEVATVTGEGAGLLVVVTGV